MLCRPPSTLVQFFRKCNNGSQDISMSHGRAAEWGYSEQAVWFFRPIIHSLGCIFRTVRSLGTMYRTSVMHDIIGSV